MSDRLLKSKEILSRVTSRYDKVLVENMVEAKKKLAKAVFSEFWNRLR